MKKQLYFVGFPEGEVLALRTIASGQDLGECHFVSDADAALKLLADKSADVVVATMSMPGKNGAELLREVSRLQPKALGFIVGDVTDQSLIISCIGGPHHFIRRPVAAADLLLQVQRGLKLDAWLSNAELRELAPRLRRLPSLPSTYFSLLKEVESPAATLQAMGNIIARDPAVTARLLHLVNSAAFSLAEKVTDPIEAISLLGVETVKSLVLCLQIFGQKDEAREAGLSLEILWEHSLLVAKFARLITFKQTVDERLAGDAFTAGLLHDVGRIVIASNLPQEYAAVVTAAREESHPLHEEETARLGVNHAKVGAYLLGLWGLPTAIVEAAAGHHAPGQTVFACEFSLLAAVHAANVFAHASSGQTDGLPLPEFDLNYFKAIKLDEQLGQWRQWCLGESLPAQSVKEAPEAPPQPTTPPRQAARFSEPAANPLAYLWKLAAVLLLGLTAGLAWHFSAASSSTPPGVLLMPASTNQPAESSPIPEEGALRPPLNTATNQADPGPTLPLPSPFDTVKVQGIFYRAANPEAIINNRTVRVGDQVNGLQVVAITQSSVTLSLGSEKRVYGMK